MEYTFGTNGPMEVLKTKGDHHTDFAGFRQVEQSYSDQTITDSFRIVRKLKSAEDVEGNCYDWYEIDRHYRVFDKTGPIIKDVDALKTQGTSLDEQTTQLQLALVEVYEIAMTASTASTSPANSIAVMSLSAFYAIDYIYADLIKKGLKTLESVPEKNRSNVETILNGESK